MATITETDLLKLISNNAGLRLIEPRIYSLFADNEIANPYDTGFGDIYDRVACNPLYNRLIWGYSISRYDDFTRDALTSSNTGYVLDLGCGSLAFTAKTYISYSDRPVVLMDQSLKMLRIAKSRLVKLAGQVPENMMFLHADALELPFLPDSFNTIISLNLLHCLEDITGLLKGLRNVLSENGRMYFTTLVSAGRFADRYLKALADSGKLIGRNPDQLCDVFAEARLPVRFDLTGSLAFMWYPDK